MTEPITRRNITYNKDLCEEVYDSDGGMGPFSDAVADEKILNTT